MVASKPTEGVRPTEKWHGLAVDSWDQIIPTLYLNVYLVYSKAEFRPNIRPSFLWSVGPFARCNATQKARGFIVT